MSKHGQNIGGATQCTDLPGQLRVRINDLSARLRRFRDEESGVLIGFGVFLILMILAVGGIGIDLMRFEYTRTSLQSTLDRAVLAAADLDQTLDARFVVEDYFAKSDMGDYLQSITVDEGLNHKQVSATAEIAMPTQLIHMLGIPTLDAKAAGTAKESIGNVEISLVLDVSGSMAWNNRLVNLKAAAKDFVDLVLGSTKPGDVSISLVPYATQVSLGASMMDEYTVTQEHNYSHCIDFLADEFSTTDIQSSFTNGFQWQRTAHFDPFTSTGTSINDHQINVEAGESLDFPVCPTDPATRILPLSSNAIDLKNHIDGLYARGNTSIDLGMKWGVALLDPDTQPVVNGLINKGEIDATFADRPKVYDSANNLKVAIVMTDGENTNQYYMLPPYNDGLSPVWRHQSGRFSVKHDNKWYYPHDDSWHDEPYKDTNGQASQQMTYQELFARGPLAWGVRYLFEPWMGSSPAWSQWYWGVMNWHNSSYKNQRLDRICKAAKAQGIIVFTIAFEAPRNGRRVLSNCASSDGHFFDADGLEIEDAFVSIAASISKLRLVQ